MYIYIGNLPSMGDQAEIANLVKKFNKNAPAQKELSIRKNKDSYFCIANIHEDKKARKFIKKYNLKSPYGYQLMVREFIHRSCFNERRDIAWREKQWRGAEKRQCERRTQRIAI